MDNTWRGILLLSVVLFLFNMANTKVFASSTDSNLSVCGSLGVKDANIAMDVAYGNGASVVVGTNGLIFRSARGGKWVQIESGVSTRLSSVVWSGNEFIAVASKKPVLSLGKWMCWSNDILRSRDGVNWQGERFGFDAEIGSIYTGNNTIILVGRDSRAAAIWIKTKKQPWKVISFDRLREIVDITWTGKYYVAVGNGNDWNTFVLRSVDGITWSRKELDSPGSFGGVASVRGGAVAVGALEDGGAIYHSHDGLNWKSDDVSASGWLNDIAVSDRSLVAVGAKGLILLKDNSGWSKRKSPTSANLYGITWTGSEFIAVGGGSDSSYPVIIRSVNGIEWKVDNLNLPQFNGHF